MEYWNNGMMNCRNAGIMERWNSELPVESVFPISNLLFFLKRLHQFK